jgi:predicted nucleic acid-binding protein
MVSETFIDSSGFYALLVKHDPCHAAAKRWVMAAKKKLRRFVTSDYVLNESSTLFKARRKRHLIPALYNSVFNSLACRVEWTDIDHFQETRMFFQKYIDHDWSFTDCSSFIVMRRLNITQALTTDSHFEEMGFMALLK